MPHFKCLWYCTWTKSASGIQRYVEKILRNSVVGRQNAFTLTMARIMGLGYGQGGNITTCSPSHENLRSASHSIKSTKIWRV